MSPVRATKPFSTPDLIPQFESLAVLAVSEADVLIEVLRQKIDLAAQVQRAKQIEHEADEIVQDRPRSKSHLQLLNRVIEKMAAAHRPGEPAA